MADDYAVITPEPVFTVTVAGPERHDGEAPYTYVVHADDEPAARALVLAYHAASHELRMTEVRIDTDHGPVWRFGFDPAIRPDVVHIPHYSFPGAPTWPDDTPGQAWSDMRPLAEEIRISRTLAAEYHRLEVARDFGLPVADIDIDHAEPPAVPGRDAVLHVMQLRARRTLSPGRPPTKGADIIPFILGTAHIRALTTAICDRDLANGVAPDEVGQILTDANYTAVNLTADTVEDPPAYYHRRLDVDNWALLKAADCYHFQIQGVGTVAAAGALRSVEELRGELIEALGVDPDDYRMRFEWDAADGWPLLHDVPAPVRRAEALIEQYQGLDHIEELSTPDWGQHISDMIADLLHYANADQNMDPWARLNMGVQHFAEEAKKQQHIPQGEPETAMLPLLVATSAGQGQRTTDFCHTLPGEILYPPSECQHCDDPRFEQTCHTLIGAQTNRATTTFEVAEVPISRAGLHLMLAKAWGVPEGDIEASDIANVADQMIATAVRFPIGAVLEKTGRRFRRRRSGTGPADPPETPAPQPAEDDEPKLWTVQASQRRDYQYTVEAVDEDGAMDAAWDAFDENRNIVDHDSDVRVSLAA